MRASAVMFSMAAGLALGASAFASPVLVQGGDLQVGRSLTVNRGDTGSTRAVDPNAIYSDVTTFTGQVAGPGGAASVGGTLTTNMLCDDLTTSAAGTVSTFRFTMFNLNTTTLSAAPQIRFFLSDGAGGGPGTIISGFNFNPISLTAGNGTILSFNIPAANMFNVPAGRIWAGIQFAQGTANTAAQLNAFASGLFNPVDVGSSADIDWLTTAPGTQASNNPVGAQRTSPFLANPVANYGWELVVPAPGSMVLLGLGGLAATRRRR